MDYFGRLSQKWEDLLNCKPIPTCTCNAAEVYAKDYEEEKVHQFLMGLDKARFSNVCTNIIGLETLPDLNSVYQRVVWEEKHLGTTRSESKETPVGFVATAGEDTATVAAARGRASVICSNCGRIGRGKECWQIIGFPDWFTERNLSSGRGGR